MHGMGIVLCPPSMKTENKPMPNAWVSFPLVHNCGGQPALFRLHPPQSGPGKGNSFRSRMVKGPSCLILGKTGQELSTGDPYHPAPSISWLIS